MKTYIKYAFTLVLTLTAILPLQAQEENGAFYIYQNDGHFDGFFYDEVQKISYSKIDTLGIEHEDFVSQEIITADSIYRIMLSAIDSVGFVQPEIKFNPQLRNMSEMGMMPYLKTQDGMKLTFSGNMPANLRPQKQDVLVCFDFERYEGGFGGKVSSVSEIGGDYVVVCDSLRDMSEIFQQFVCVEEYGKDHQGNVVLSRVAGMKNPRRVSGQYDGTIWSFTANPYLPFAYKDFTASISLNMGMEVKLKSSWNIPLWGAKQFKIEVSKIASVGASVNLDFKMAEPLSFETKFNNLAPIYIPAAAPIFRVKCLPEGFLRSEIHATATISTKKFKKQITESFEFNDWNISARMNFGDVPPEPGSEAEPDINVSGSLNGFVQGGVKFPFVIRTNEFFESILAASVQANVYVGPKLSGEINFNALDAIISHKQPTFLYNSLKDSKATFSPFCADYEVKSLVKAFVGANDTLTLIDGSRDFVTWDRYLMPAFDNPIVQPSKDGLHPADVSAWRADGSAKFLIDIKPKRDLLTRTKIGAVIYNDNDSLIFSRPGQFQSDISEWYSKEEGFDQDTSKDNSDYRKLMAPYDGMVNIRSPYDNLKPGKYKVYPGFAYTTTGELIPADPCTEFEIPEVYFKPIKDTLLIAAPSDTTFFAVPLPTNGKLEGSIKREYDTDNWHYYHRYEHLQHSSNNIDTVFLTCNPNPEVFCQKNTRFRMAVAGYNKKGEWTVLPSQTVTVRQDPGGVFTGLHIKYKSGIEIPYYDSYKSTRVDVDMTFNEERCTSFVSERNGDIVTLKASLTTYQGHEYSVDIVTNAKTQELISGHFNMDDLMFDAENVTLSEGINSNVKMENAKYDWYGDDRYEDISNEVTFSIYLY